MHQNKIGVRIYIELLTLFVQSIMPPIMMIHSHNHPKFGINILVWHVGTRKIIQRHSKYTKKELVLSYKVERYVDINTNWLHIPMAS